MAKLRGAGRAPAALVEYRCDNPDRRGRCLLAALYDLPDAGLHVYVPRTRLSQEWSQQIDYPQQRPPILTPVADLTMGPVAGVLICDHLHAETFRGRLVDDAARGRQQQGRTLELPVVDGSGAIVQLRRGTTKAVTTG